MNPALVSRLLRPLGNVFSLGVAARNALYDRGWQNVQTCGRPVISIGNLTAGGTGKTPFTQALAEQLRGWGHTPAIISRGYRSEMEYGVGRVDLQSGKSLPDLVRRFGDEPVMLAQRLNDVPVFVGRDKVSVARTAVDLVSPTVIVADDAFQHRRLKRDFDIVLIDCSAPGWHFNPLPAGRMREPFAALKRAQAVIFTKVNLAEASRVERLHDLARVEVDSAALPVFMDIEFRASQVFPLGSTNPQSAVSFRSLAHERLFLFCAIGRPEGFRQLIENESGAEIAGLASYPDHHFFTPQDCEDIARKAKSVGATCLVCTEKDAVKLKAGGAWSMPVFVSRLEAIARGTWDELHARLPRASV